MKLLGLQMRSLRLDLEFPWKCKNIFPGTLHSSKLITHLTTTTATEIMILIDGRPLNSV